MSAALAMQQPKLLVPDFTPEHFVCIDFETFWDVDYTLKKLTTSDYVYDDRFETIGVSVFDGEEVAWLEHHDFAAWAKTVPWEKTAVLAHHADFDGLVLAHHYDVHPKVLMCTMSMARAYGIDGGVSLENLAEHFEVGHKGNEVLQTKGMRRRDFSREQWLRYGEYSCNDAMLTQAIFDKMVDQGFPEPELFVISATVKMFTEPKLIVDEPLLTQYLSDEQRRKQGLLDRIERDKSLVMSNDKFAAELKAMGVAPPTKVSVARTKKARLADPKAKPVIGWAFAKTDPGMQELLEHEEDEVRWLAEARVAVKSTINETRTQRFLRMGKNGKPLPVQLKWCLAAETPVLTDRGWVPIVEVCQTDRVWDGVEWATHEGLVDQGVKEVVTYAGVTATPNHLIKTESGWRPWGVVTKNESLFRSALFSARSPLSNGGIRRDEAGSRFFGAHAGGSANRHGNNSERALERSVLRAAQGDVAQESALNSRLRFPIRSSVDYFSTRSTAQSIGVLGKRILATIATAAEGLRSTLLGSQIVPNFSGTQLLFQATTYLGWSSIESTTIGATSPEMSGSFRREPTCRTNEKSPCFSERSSTFAQRTRVYDLRMTGSRNCFTILSCNGPLVVHNCGAHTTRWSATGKTNFQNLQRTNRRDATKGVLRKALLAPFGWKFVAADSGQIEARITAWLAGDEELLELFAQNRDVYSAFASQVYGRHIDRKKNPEDELPGQVGKVGVLGLGYGQGWFKLAEGFLRGALAPPIQFDFNMSQQMGVDLNKWYQQESKIERVRTEMVSRLPIEELQIHCAVSNHVVNTYRNARKPIVELWRTMEDVLQAMLEDNANYSFGPNECLRVVRHGIELPNGLMLRYPGLEYNAEETKSAPEGFSYLAQYGKKRIHTYGGAMTENVVQALARIVVSEQLLDMMARGYEPTLCTHDDLAYVVPDGAAPWLSWRLQETMKTPPVWAAGLPLSVEGGYAQSYGSAK